MKTSIFVAITLISGAIAGTMLGSINQIIVEPYIERAIQLEVQGGAHNGEMINPLQFAAYRLWQKGGEIAAGTILGMSLGSLFGIVFAYGRDTIPGASNKKKSLIIAGIMWFTLFLVPALKYPANPPAVGDPETIYYRQGLYLAYISISGFAALGLTLIYRKLETVRAKRILIPVVYAAIMATAYFVMPSNPDRITAPMDLVFSFRIVSELTMSMFWLLLGITLGAFWDRLRPHETAKISLS